MTEREDPSSAALRASEDRYRALYERTPALLHSIDRDGRLVIVSDRWLERFGYTREEVIGRRTTELLTDDCAAYARDVVLPEFFRTGKSTDVPYTFVRKDGTHFDVLLSAIAERDTNGDVVRSLAVLTDLTERKKLEGALRSAQRMESLGRLAAGIAHDFNNVLAVIRTFGDLASARDRGDARVKGDLSEIREAVMRASSLTRELLMFSRRDPNDGTVADPNAVLHDVERLLRRAIGEHLELRIHIGQVARVPTSPAQLEQVLLNLAVNARDAMPGGGTIEVAVDEVLLDVTTATRLAGARAGRYVRICVADSGSGMDETTAAHAFEPFFTTKGGAGTGLGLAIVYGVARQAGGFATLSSELGRGTKVVVYFPATDAPATTVPRDVVSPPTRGHGESIVVVEDDVAVRRAIGEVLEHAGYRAQTYATPDAALLALDAGTEVDALLTDTVMPGMSGPELVARVLATRPDLPVVSVSGWADHPLPEGARAGVVLDKPFSRDDLLRAVARALDMGRDPPRAPR